MAVIDLTDGTNSRIESSLTGAEGKFSAPVSRLEQIINGEDIKPLSRIEEVMTDYVKTHGGGNEGTGIYKMDLFIRQAITTENSSTNNIMPNAIGETYNPHKWMWTGDGGVNAWDNIPANVDSNGKWHVYANSYTAHNLFVGGIYMAAALDPNKISRINYQISQGNTLEFDANDRKQIIVALINKVDNVARYWPEQSSTVKYNFHKKYYEVEGNIYPVNSIAGSISLEDVTEPVYLVYCEYGSELTFESVEFVLKED